MAPAAFRLPGGEAAGAERTPDGGGSGSGAPSSPARAVGNPVDAANAGDPGAAGDGPFLEAVGRPSAARTPSKPAS